MNFKYFSILFELPTIDSAQKINFKAHFLFSKKCKEDTLTKFFATPANFNRPLYQSQDLIRSLNIFPYYLPFLLLIQPKNFNFKAHFLFSKKCKGGTLDKDFLQLLQTLTGRCTKPKKFNFKSHFLFSKKFKGGPLTKIFCNSCKL